LNRKTLFISLLLIAPVVVYAGNDEAVESWLQKMSNAAHTVNYIGKFVYQQDKQLSMMEIVHAVDASGGERERLLSLDDVGREVIREKDRVTCILPDRQSVVVEKGRPKLQFPPEFPVNIEHLKGIYAFELSKVEKVAGHAAQKISIKPVDKFRYGHHLWVDVDTGLLLNTHLLDEKGQLLEQFMFTEVKYMDKIPEDNLKPRNRGENYTWYESEDDKETNESSSSMAWLVAHMPAGFVNDMQRNHNLPNKTAVKHMVYSDGIASVSVFIEKQEKQSASLVGASRMGAVNAYGRIVNDHHVTAVGEVPQATVKMMTESVEVKH
jgi:sigma-E factor negative regulatory protein RseB